jgi:hypothetical protein
MTAAITEIFNQRAVAQGYLSTVDVIVTNAVNRAMAGPKAVKSDVAYALTAIEPAVLETTNSTLTFEAQRDQIIALLADQMDGFFAKYYPLAADAFDEATNWLVNSITSGGTGISQAVEDQIWQRGRDRVVADGMRAESQVLNDFASRGFSLPSGAMAARIQEVRFEQLGKTQELSRDAAIKQADMTVENLRFAVGLAIESRMKALQAAADYIKALMSGTDTAARVASLNSDAKARMVAATADLYRARLSRDELAMKIPLSNQDATLKVQGMNIDGYGQGASTAASAVAAEAGAFADAAKSALSAISTIVSESNSSFN